MSVEHVERRRKTQVRMCEQHCGAVALVYAIDRAPGGWGGFYCAPCADKLNFMVVDQVRA